MELDLDDVLGGGALCTLHDVELDLVAFSEAAEASAEIAVWWTKQSFSPLSGVMKPKPFASLNHFTVPVVRAMSPNSSVVCP